MKKLTVEITVRQGLTGMVPVEVPGYRLSVPGLVATRPVRRGGKVSKRGWQLTHEPSGYCFSHFRARTLASAELMSQPLADSGVDWTLPKSELVDCLDLSQARRLEDAVIYSADWPPIRL